MTDPDSGAHPAGEAALRTLHLQAQIDSLGSDIELRNREADIRRDEVGLRKQELELQRKQQRWVRMALLLGFLGTIFVPAITGWMNRTLESDRHQRTLSIEADRYTQQRRLEVTKHQQALRLEAIKSVLATQDLDEGARRLNYLVEADLIADPDGKLATLLIDPKTRPFLASKSKAARFRVQHASGESIEYWALDQGGVTLSVGTGATLRIRTEVLDSGQGIVRFELGLSEPADWSESFDLAVGASPTAVRLPNDHEIQIDLLEVQQPEQTAEGRRRITGPDGPPGTGESARARISLDRQA